MEIEDTNVEPGTFGHIVEVFGEWNEEMFNYYFNITFDDNLVTFIELNVSGCICDGLDLHEVIYGENFVNMSAFIPWGMSPGEGKLAKIIFDNTQEANLQHGFFYLMPEGETRTGLRHYDSQASPQTNETQRSWMLDARSSMLERQKKGIPSFIQDPGTSIQYLLIASTIMRYENLT